MLLVLLAIAASMSGDRPVTLPVTPQSLLHTEQSSDPAPRIVGSPVTIDHLTGRQLRNGRDDRHAVAFLEQRIYVDGDAAPEMLWALGTARIAIKDFDGAVSALRAAATQAPKKGGVSSDLGAAYYLRCQRDGVIADLVLALDASVRATRLEPAETEAWFNVAIILDRLEWYGLAERAWARLLSIEPDMTYAGFARQRQRQLRGRGKAFDAAAAEQQFQSAESSRDHDALSRLARQSPEAARRFVEERLLSRWARESHTSTDCMSGTTVARTLGAAVAETTGDRFLTDLGRDMEKLCGLPDARRRAWSAAVDRLSRGRLLADAGDMTRARAELTQAERILAGTRALQPLSAFWILFAAFPAEHPAALEPRIAAAAGQARTSSHHYLLGRLLLLGGSVALRRAHRADALVSYEAAVERFEQAREVEYSATTMALVGQSLREHGDYINAWSWLVRSMRQLDRVGTPRRGLFVVYNTMLPALDEGWIDLVQLLQQPLLEQAGRWNDPTGWVSALLLSAEAAAQRRDMREAGDHLLRAEAELTRVPDKAYRRELEVQIAATRGLVNQRDNPREAVTSLDAAVTHFTERGHLQRLAIAYLWRGRAHASLGAIDDAIADWRRGLDVFEDQRTGIRGAQLRISHLDQVWGLFGETIEALAIDRGQPQQALEVFERSRARALLDSLDERQQASPESPIVSARLLPAGTAVAIYASLDDQLLIWVLQRDGAPRQVRVEVTRAELAALVRQFRFQIERGLPDTALASRLHALLIAPLTPALTAIRALAVVADGPLEQLPFAALVDGATNRYLLEDYALSMAPSVTLLARASARLQRATLSGSVVIAAVPDGGEAGLPYLTAAVEEARLVGNLHSAPVSMVGREATKQHLLSVLPGAAMLHFAGHAVADARFPSRSFLLAAPGTGGDGERRIVPADIAALKLPRMKLAVLSACSTAAGIGGHGEGALSLARPFLAAGVPQVVGSLWDISDRETASLLVDFHRRLRAGESTVDALRAAQLAMKSKAGGRMTSAWAPFVVIGGVSEMRGGETDSR